MTHPFFSEQAKRDIDEVWFYIALNGTETAADRFIDELHARCDRLALAPGIGRPRPEFGPETRGYTHKKYLIIYRPREGGVEIARILHGARDIDRIMADESR